MKGYSSGYIRSLNAANYIVKRALGSAIAGASAGAISTYRKKKAGSRTALKKGRKGRRYGKTYRGMSNTIVMNKRKKSVVQNTSRELTSTALAVPARKPTAYKLAMACLEPQWYRIQGLTEFDSTTGFYAIANRITSTGAVILPAHVWDITSCPNNTGLTTTSPEAGFALGFVSTGTNANTATYSLARNQSDGTTGTTAVWNGENTSEDSATAGAAMLPHRKQYHEYTHVKMNLYGVRRRSVRYLVQLVMVKDTFADFITAADTNESKKNLFDYLTRPFVYNNLNIGNPKVREDIKILKSYETIVDPIDVDVTNQGTNQAPKMHTLNWFIKHNRMRRYDWRQGQTPDHLQNAAWDVENDSGHDTRVDPRYRVYLLIRALDPDRRTLAAGDGAQTTASADNEPSYDMVLRNKFLVPI